MQIYLDLIWILNLLFDWLILLVVAWVIRHPFNHFRIFLASLYASLIIPLSFIETLDWLNLPVIKLIYSFGIILIAFNYHSIRRFIIYFLCFYFINFSVGGGLFGLHYVLQRQEMDVIWLTQIGYGNTVSWAFILLAFPIFLWFTKDRLFQLSVIKLRHEHLYDVKVNVDNQRNAIIKGFYDTGNQLSHPLVNKPIVLIDEITAINWFGEQCVTGLKQHQITQNGNAHFEYIPLRKAGGEQGVIPVFQVKQISVRVNMFIHTSKRVYVGIHFGHFSNRLNYNILLNPSIFQSKNSKVEHVKGVI